MTAPVVKHSGVESYTSITPDIEALSLLLDAGALKLGAESVLGLEESSTGARWHAVPGKARHAVLTDWPRDAMLGIAGSLVSCEHIMQTWTQTSSACTVPLRRTHAVQPKKPAYTFARRLKQISRLESATRPSDETLDFAKFLDAYVSALADSRRVDKPSTVVSVIDASSVLVEWNVRGKVIRHLECEIREGATTHFGLLQSIETQGGRIERMTEIPEASIEEVLSQIESLLSHSARVPSRR